MAPAAKAKKSAEDGSIRRDTGIVALSRGALGIVTYQAIQLGYAPRSKVVYTSATARGQVYIPA